MRRAYSVVCAVTAVAAAFVTGCTQDTDTRAATTAAQRAEPRELTSTEELRLSDAQQRLIARCMTEEGFTYRVYRPLTVEEHHPVGYMQGRCRLGREHGYGSRIRAKADTARLGNRTSPTANHSRGTPRELRHRPRRRPRGAGTLGGGAGGRDVPQAGGRLRSRRVGEASVRRPGDLVRRRQDRLRSPGPRHGGRTEGLAVHRGGGAVVPVHATRRARPSGPGEARESGAAAVPAAAGGRSVRGRAGGRRSGCHLRPRDLTAHGRRGTRSPSHGPAARRVRRRAGHRAADPAGRARPGREIAGRQP